MGKSRVAAIRPDEIDGVWPKVEGYIDSALKHTMYEQTLEDVKNKGLSGKYLFLLFYCDDKIKGVITMEMYDYPTKKVAGIVHLAGENLDDWIEFADTSTKRIAKEQGADEIIIVGRKGWVRKLIKYGYNVQYMVLTTTL